MTKQSMLKTALAGTTVLAALLAAPSPASTQESGAEVWGRTCGRCHRMQPPNKYDARHWEAIVRHMALNARMTADEEAAVSEFLMGAARRLAAESPSEGSVEVAQLASVDPAIVVAELIARAEGDAIYKKQCAACHGDSGEGDGPAAGAFNPKPTDLTDADRMSELTDDQLLTVLKDGKGAMPGFSAILKIEDLQALIEYLRTLTDGDDGR
jgi:mono/diheme cytochrome c family protein